jgi:hypothetical protein
MPGDRHYDYTLSAPTNRTCLSNSTFNPGSSFNCRASSSR